MDFAFALILFGAFIPFSLDVLRISLSLFFCSFLFRWRCTQFDFLFAAAVSAIFSMFMLMLMLLLLFTFSSTRLA